MYYISCVYMSVCMCSACVPGVYGDKKGMWIAWNLRYRVLCAVLWVPRTKLWSSAGIARAQNC